MEESIIISTYRAMLTNLRKILLTELLKYLSKIVKLVELHVKEDNEVAIRLYESLGFETYFSNYGHLSMFKRI